MAQSISISSGSVLIGNPIVIKVKPDSLTVTPALHRVILTVNATLVYPNTQGGEVETFELSASVEEGIDQLFDISTVLRTVSRGFTHGEVPSTGATYPYIAFTLSAHDEYMIDGILYENVNVCEYSGNLYSIMGARNNLERRTLATNIAKLTRKPLTGEVVSYGHYYVYPINISVAGGLTLTMSPESRVWPAVSVERLVDGGATEINGHSVYMDPLAENRMNFQFVNGFGVVESASAEFLEEKETEGTSELHTLAGPLAYNQPPILAALKSDREVTLKCSSGYVNREWAQWWHDEFLGSDNFRRGLKASYWIQYDGVWRPCVCVMDDDTTIYDKTKNNMLHIDFTVHLAY